MKQITDQKSKKTRKKAITRGINIDLIRLDSPKKKYYQRAYHCSDKLIQVGSSIQSHYCNCRTCLTCNGKRTAAYIDYYGEQILALSDPQFVTLTSVTVECHEVDTLRYYIDSREETWKKIRKNASKQGIRLVGMKSMEVTARPDEKYHIHFHFIIEGKDNAEWVKKQWLNHNPNALEYLQKIYPINSKQALLEVFKYGTKFADKSYTRLPNGSKKEEWVKVEARRIDFIIQALWKKRLISVFGGIKRLRDDDVNEIKNDVVVEIEDKIYDEWIWKDIDWFSVSGGDKFSAYTITSNMKKVFYSDD